MLHHAQKLEGHRSRPERNRSGSAEAERSGATTEPVGPAPGPKGAPAEKLADASFLQDDAAELQAGQMQRSEFLLELEDRVRHSVEAALASEGACTACPYLDYWFSHYRSESAEHIRRVLAHYAPDAARASSAREAIALIALRAADKARRWLDTGRIDGMPMDMDAGLVAANAIHSRLGDGHPLEVAARSRFEPAFGRPLSHVRIHADARGDRLASSMQARAVTIGPHIAFRSNAFRPGTPDGDALLAHELAHTVQQRQASRLGDAMGAAQTFEAEAEADRQAAATLGRLWGNANDLEAPDAGPLTESGLSLRRCQNNDIDCGASKTTVDAAFATARTWLATALERCRSSPLHANVAAALLGAFRASSLPAGLISALSAIQKELGATRTNYCPGRGPSCGPSMEGATNVAFVSTRNEGQLGGPIYFCPTFFDVGSRQALTVIHEACHLSPGFYPDVTYWGRGDYASHSTEELLRNADSYAVFVYWVVNGSAPAAIGAK